MLVERGLTEVHPGCPQMCSLNSHEVHSVPLVQSMVLIRVMKKAAVGRKNRGQGQVTKMTVIGSASWQGAATGLQSTCDGRHSQ